MWKKTHDLQQSVDLGSLHESKLSLTPSKIWCVFTLKNQVKNWKIAVNQNLIPDWNLYQIQALTLLFFHQFYQLYI